MDTFVETLQNNPIFQLSLSSKELFHSNFLAWLAEDKNTRGIFSKLMQVWLNDTDWKFNDKEMVVKREYNHFDFCICEKYTFNKSVVTGRVNAVLENKFKSIAYKSQLQNYKDKTKTLNEEVYKNKFKVENEQQGITKARLPRNWRNNVEITDTKYILLTLAENFLDKEAIKGLGWTIITYSEYSKTLRDNLKLITNNFYREIIEHYCDFIDIFSIHVNECLNNINITDNWDVLNRTDFTNIRCNDIWQKLVMHKCAFELEKKLKKNFSMPVIASSDKEIWGKNGTENKDKLFLVVDYFHGEAVLELKYLIPKKGVFVLQQQGDHPLRVGFLDMTSKQPKYSKKDDIANWNKETKRVINEAEIGEIIPKKNASEFEKALYNSYGTFYYNELYGKNKNINDTLDDMVATIYGVVKIITSNNK